MKEKTIAAKRSGVDTIVFPKGNKKDFEELPKHVKEGLDVRFVDHYDEIYQLAFKERPIESPTRMDEATQT